MKFQIVSYNTAGALKDERADRRGMQEFVSRFKIIMLQDTGITTPEQRDDFELKFPGHRHHWPMKDRIKCFDIVTCVSNEFVSKKMFFSNVGGHFLIVEASLDGTDRPPVYLINVYRRPNAGNELFYTLSHYMRYKLPVQQILLAGDLNAWIGTLCGINGRERATEHPTTNEKGRMWTNVLNNFFMAIQTGQEETARITFARNQGTELDYVAKRVFNNQVVKAEATPQWGSDHCPMVITWKPFTGPPRRSIKMPPMEPASPYIYKFP